MFHDNVALEVDNLNLLFKCKIHFCFQSNSSGEEGYLKDITWISKQLKTIYVGELIFKKFFLSLKES